MPFLLPIVEGKRHFLPPFPVGIHNITRLLALLSNLSRLELLYENSAERVMWVDTTAETRCTT
jgi:hypothetical protein